MTWLTAITPMTTGVLSTALEAEGMNEKPRKQGIILFILVEFEMAIPCEDCRNCRAR
jgi:hypothetical protein